MFSVLAAALLAVCNPASAQGMALDPQIRAHVGLNYVDGPSGFGITGGMDTRLTRIVALDVGGFASPIPVAESWEWTDTEATTPEYYRLRHGVYATAGLRLPHPQPKRWAWEVFARGGGGVLWIANLNPEVPSDDGGRFSIRAYPAGLLGGDALVRFGKIGVRASGKAWMFNVVQTSPIDNFFVVRSQWALEALVQW
jgi:hypothetical protein